MIAILSPANAARISPSVECFPIRGGRTLLSIRCWIHVVSPKVSREHVSLSMARIRAGRRERSGSVTQSCSDFASAFFRWLTFPRQSDELLALSDYGTGTVLWSA